jgi:zinc protease
MLRNALLLWLACALTVVTDPAPAARAQVKLPRVEYRERTLANGLRVLSVEDHSAPTVSIQVWYHVGSKDDPDGRSGFAHLFEHIMFKSTKNMPDEMLDRLTEDIGGFNNAGTADDFTFYYEVVPSNYLETLLWAEAERLSSLKVHEGNFKSERDVVKEEFRQRYLANPYGRFRLLIEMKSFAKHPYKRPGIGNIEELNAASIEDVKAFHATFYRPDNATLVVAGDFDPRQLDAWVDRYFAPIPKPGAPIPRVTIKEPERSSEQRFVERAPNVPLPAVAVTYLAPPAAHDDIFALQVAEAILSAGESSRLYNSLVYEQQLAASASAGTDLREDVSLFVLSGIAAGGKKVEDVEGALLAELKRMQDAPVAAAEIEKARTQLVTIQVRQFETSDGKGQALGYAAVVLGDPRRVNTDIERLQAVTAADVQRVMRKYFSDNNRVVIHYLPEQQAPAAEQGGGK